MLPETQWCKEHNKNMKLRDGKYGPYYSHVINYENNEWCSKNPKEFGLEANSDPAWVSNGKDQKEIKAADTQETWRAEQAAKEEARNKRITRQHSQDMAIQQVELEIKIGKMPADLGVRITELTDHFVRDAEQGT